MKQLQRTTTDIVLADILQAVIYGVVFTGCSQNFVYISVNKLRKILSDNVFASYACGYSEIRLAKTRYQIGCFATIQDAIKRFRELTRVIFVILGKNITICNGVQIISSRTNICRCHD